jgi:hypothetical protein
LPPRRLNCEPTGFQHHGRLPAGQAAPGNPCGSLPGTPYRRRTQPGLRLLPRPLRLPVTRRRSLDCEAMRPGSASASTGAA